MAKRDDNPHRLNLVIPQALLEELRTVAKERFGAKDNHLTGQPEISQTLLKLIRIGIDTVISEDRYDESLEDKPDTLQDKFNGLATEFASLKERVKELEQSLQTHIHTGKQLEVEETSSTQPLQIPVQTDIHTGNKDEASLPEVIQSPIQPPEQIEETQTDDPQQESLQPPNTVEPQSADIEQIGVYIQTHIEEVPPEASENLETSSEIYSGATTDENIVQTDTHTDEQIESSEDLSQEEVDAPGAKGIVEGKQNESFENKPSLEVEELRFIMNQQEMSIYLGGASKGVGKSSVSDWIKKEQWFKFQEHPKFVEGGWSWDSSQKKFIRPST